MLFLFGFLSGLLIAILVIVMLTYFRRVIEQKSIIIEKQIDRFSPRPKGFLIEPESEADIARKRIIEKNNQEGRSTKLSELQ